MIRFALPLLPVAAWPAGFAAWLECAAAARAAGGHFDVDDAVIVDPGRCQGEIWLNRAAGIPPTSFHLGPNCRVGALELGLNCDRVSTLIEQRGTLGPQVKYVVDPVFGPLSLPVSVGIAWIAAVDLKRGGRPAHTVYLPMTWVASERLALDANLGADWVVDGARSRRTGVSAEFVAHEKLTLVADRRTRAFRRRLGLPHRRPFPARRRHQRRPERSPHRPERNERLRDRPEP